MAFDYIYLRDESQNNNLAKVDNATGERVDTIDLGDEVTAVERDTEGHVYVGVGAYGDSVRKYTPDLGEQLWESSEEVYAWYHIRVGPNEDDVYTGGDAWVARIDSTSGDVVWKSAIAENDVMDMSFDDQYLYIHYDDTYEQQRVDPTSGSVEEEVMMSGYNTHTSGIVVTDEWYISSGYRAFALYRSDDFSEGDYFDDDEFNVYNYTSLESNEDGLYTAGGDGGRVAHVDFDGNTQWQMQLDPDWLRSIDVSPNAVWVVDDSGLYRLDPDTGDVVWHNENVTQSYPGYSLGGFPSMDMIGKENYFVPIELSGTVVDGGDPVSGAKVTAIDDTSDEIVTTTTTDSDGNWSATVPDTQLHIVAQYEDDSGTKYNTESYPYVNQ